MFLTHIAQDLLNRFGTDMSKVAVVFPNKRASLFLNNELARLHPESPIWCPTYITISELMRQHSDLEVADQILLICRLYTVFRDITGFETETLDQFYPWGQLLLADFDDLDKNLGEADKIFSLLSDIHDLDSSNYLSQEQEEILKQFFATFSSEHNTRMREKFLRLWNKLGDIYTTYRDSLRDDNIAYEGMLYRDVAESNDLVFEYQTYCFVGFNMLQKVEQQLFSTLKRQDKALFYWDYDTYYLNDQNEAGHFIKQYLTRFPDAIPHIDRTNFINTKQTSPLSTERDNVEKQEEPTITFVQSPTENLQARFVRDWLLENDRYKAGARTAIVMSDEHLLQTIIHSLPEELRKVNITTGYPLSQSPVVSLIHYLIDLQTIGRITGTNQFRLRNVSNVLQHPYIQYISENAIKILRHLSEDKIYFPDIKSLTHPVYKKVIDKKEIVIDINAEELAPLFIDINTIQGTQNIQLLTYLQNVIKLIALNQPNDNPLQQESLYRTYLILQRLLDLVEKDVLIVDIVTMRRLINQVINSTTVPFHGEPVEGIQIMGILETRCLDFDHILLLSCNEGNLPKGVNDSSFIPHSIRHAFNLTTVENKVSIFSYYFHRLLQRSSDVTIAYNTSTEGMNSGEMSRFMLQLMVESGLNIKRVSLKTGVTTTSSSPQEIIKTPEVQAKLSELIAPHRRISPSSLAKYLRCQLMYYYIYVLGLQQDDLDSIDEMDNMAFGTIFHAAAESIYNSMQDANGMITKEKIKLWQKDEDLIKDAVNDAFKTCLFHLPKDAPYTPTLNGLQLINHKVIVRLINDLLKYDLSIAPFRLVGNEIDIREDIKIHFSFNNTEHVITIGGIIDRLDIVNNQVRVIDYKTGANEQGKMSSIEDIFDPAKLKDHSDYYLQAFLYATILQRGQYWVKPRKDNEGNDIIIPVKDKIGKLPISPALLFVQKTRRPDYTPILGIDDTPINDISTIIDEYWQQLSILIEEIHNPAIPFRPTDNTKQCDTCPFMHICKSV